MQSRKAALAIVVKVSGERDLRYAALDGVVDHTSEAFPSGSGSSAMGPPRSGRKRWYAVTVGMACASDVKKESIDSGSGGDEEEEEARFSVATTPWRL